MLLYSVMMIPDILEYVWAVQIVTYAPKWHFMIPLTLNIRFHTFFLTHVADTNIVCSSPFKKGEPKFWKFQKGGEPEKKFWGGGNQKGGKDFQK